MRYIEEYHMGYDAGSGGLPSTDNPHVWRTVPWWAWYAGWVAGQKDYGDDNLITEEQIYARTKDRS